MVNSLGVFGSIHLIVKRKYQGQTLAGTLKDIDVQQLDLNVTRIKQATEPVEFDHELKTWSKTKTPRLGQGEAPSEVLYNARKLDWS